MEKNEMKRSNVFALIISFFVLFLFPISCHQNNIMESSVKKIDYRNMQMIEEFSPINFLPKDTSLAIIKGKQNNWIVGDFDNDSFGEILFAYHYKSSIPNNPTMGAILLKQNNGKWEKKYEFRESAIYLYIAESADITGDGITDLILGWGMDSEFTENHIYLYRWDKKDLESLGNFSCSKLIIDDFKGIYGQDGQYELGIWTQTESSLTSDIFRWNDFNSLPLLFPDDYGKPYTQQKLIRAEDLEVVYFRDYVIPELLNLEKEFPNEPMYDFSLIQAYIKALLTEEASQKINNSEDSLYQVDFEKIPYLKAQIYFIKNEITSGKQILQKELIKTINRVDAGTTLELLGRAYAKNKEWDKAMIAYDNAHKFHIPIPQNNAYDGENQFQLSLAKDKARLEVMKHVADLRDKISDSKYRNYFQNLLETNNANKSLPRVYVSEFHLSFNEYADSYATVIFWDEKGKKKEIILMSIDEDQHKININYAPSKLEMERTKSGWKLLITFRNKNLSFSPQEKASQEIKKIILVEGNSWKLVNALE